MHLDLYSFLSNQRQTNFFLITGAFLLNRNSIKNNKYFQIDNKSILLKAIQIFWRNSTSYANINHFSLSLNSMN